jgi:hypothetical protein
MEGLLGGNREDSMNIQIIGGSKWRDGLETRCRMSLRISAEVLASPASWNPIKDFYKDQASHKTTDMGPEGNASHIAWGKACREQLDEKPIPEKDKSGDLKKLEEDENGDQRHNLRPRIKKKVCPHDPGNRAAGPDGWDIGIPVGHEVDESSSHPGKEVENKITNMAQPVLNIISENIEKPHVSKDVEKSPMKKHGGQEWKPLLKGRKLDRELRIRIS